MNLPNGHLLQNGKYRLTHVVGQGGFGITYKGVWYTEVKGSLGTVKTEVPIAIKEYFFKDYCYRDENSCAVKAHSETGKNIFHKFKEKLIKEARILSDVHHPHIVNVLEVFEENNTAYIAMEYIPGLSLKELMERNGILPEARVLRYIHQIGEALQFVHENNILHLDIKPSNILIDQSDRARLIDFGVSKRYDTLDQQETSTDMLTLSKGFASIEQYDNEGTQSFSPYPDIYSLGATIYNLLTGKIPTESILRATRPFAKPSELNPDITAKTESIILKAMEVVPSDRFSCIREMMDALDLPKQEIKQTIKTSPTLPVEKEGDTTLLYQPAGRNGLTDDENEQTILNDQPETFTSDKKKQTNTILYLALVCIFALVVITVFVSYNKNTNNPDPVVIHPETLRAAVNETIEEPETGNHSQVDETESLSVVPQSTEKEPEDKPADSQPQPREEEVPVVQPVVEPVAELNESATEQPVEETPEAAYSDLVASGIEKMSSADFEGALNDFTKAGEIELTEDIIQYKSQAKKELISKRKSQYREMMSLGELKVVRKLSTGLFGAIDSEGIERIPCQYMISSPTSTNGRAFERKDKLYDIYDSEGKPESQGAPFYN